MTLYNIEDDSYAAGIIDGEGSIGISHRTSGDSYILCIQVSMTHPEVPFWLHSIYGGHIGTYAQGARSWGSRYVHKWSIYGVDAIKFLSSITPHLKEKKLQAESALDFPIGVKGKKLSNDDKLLQEDMYNLLKEMKIN